MNAHLDKATFWKLFVCWDAKDKEVLMAKTISKRFLRDANPKLSLQRNHIKELITSTVRNEVELLYKCKH